MMEFERNWDDFDRFDKVIDKYMPSRGEGETRSSQIVTAVNKLVYGFYNNGDVFDNTGHLRGWCNNLSSYANWLYLYASIDCRKILDRIYECENYDDYSCLLYDLAEMLLDEDYLRLVDRFYSKDGSIYKCDFKFKFDQFAEEDDEIYV